MVEKDNNEVIKRLNQLSNKLHFDGSPLSVILAAGQGKRIKSNRSKMLHEIWGVPTVRRVASAAIQGLKSANQIIVTGIKALEVATDLGACNQRIFVLQKEQLGTGHATRVAIEAIPKHQKIGDIYIFPGDIGLITVDEIARFKAAFEASDCGMMVVTGQFSGEVLENNYGRIIRVPERDITGTATGKEQGRLIEIREHKDILALENNATVIIQFRGRNYRFTRDKLLRIREYNSGVYAIKFPYLIQFIEKIGFENIQQEMYITDLILLLNQQGINIGVYSAKDNHTVMGFNTKSVLYEMNRIYQQKIWKLIKDIVTISDENDFFIADEVIDQIIALDQQYPALDISLGKGSYIGASVRLSRGVSIGTGTKITGNVFLGENCRIANNVEISAEDDREVIIQANSVVCSGNVIRGQVKINANCLIDNGVIIFGDKEHQTIIGENTVIRGFSIIRGVQIPANQILENTVRSFESSV